MKTLALFFRTFLLIIFSFVSQQLVAQETPAFERPDVVYLKDGSIFRGKIVYYEIGKILKFKLSPDQEVVFDANQVKKIIQESTEKKLIKNAQKKQAYAFKEKGLYYAARIGYIGGNNVFGNYTDGFNVHVKGGHQFSRWLGVGIGTGVDFYNVNLGSVVPVYGEVRGYFKKANVSPFYTLATGVGIPIKNEDSFFGESEMGLYLAPNLGIRFGGSAESNLTISLGLQWQKVKYIRDNNADFFRHIEDDYTFKRFNFNVGVLF